MPPGHPSTPIPIPAGSKLCSCCMGRAVGARPPPCPRLGTPQRLGTLPLSAPRGLGSPSPTHAANPPGGLYSRISTCRHRGYLPFSEGFLCALLASGIGSSSQRTGTCPQASCRRWQLAASSAQTLQRTHLEFVSARRPLQMVKE